MLNKFVFAFVLIASPAWACESYEECMKCEGAMDSLNPMGNFQTCYQKAIAFKLDEISHKLDQKESDPNLLAPPIAFHGCGTGSPPCE